MLHKRVRLICQRTNFMASAHSITKRLNRSLRSLGRAKARPLA
jgi:hypothetical protein